MITSLNEHINEDTIRKINFIKMVIDEHDEEVEYATYHGKTLYGGNKPDLPTSLPSDFIGGRYHKDKEGNIGKMLYVPAPEEITIINRELVDAGDSEFLTPEFKEKYTELDESEAMGFFSMNERYDERKEIIKKIDTMIKIHGKRRPYGREGDDDVVELFIKLSNGELSQIIPAEEYYSVFIDKYRHDYRLDPEIDERADLGLTMQQLKDIWHNLTEIFPDYKADLEGEAMGFFSMKESREEHGVLTDFNLFDKRDDVTKHESIPPVEIKESDVKMNSVQDFASWLVKRDVTDKLKHVVKPTDTYDDVIKKMNEL